MIKLQDKTAIIAGKERISYNALLENIHDFTRHLNISEGDRVVIYSENRLEWIYAFYATWMLGGIPVPIDFMAAGDDVAFILNDCRPSVIFVSRGLKEVIRESTATTGTPAEIKVFEELKSTGLRRSASRKIGADRNKTAVIIYTSGTTGSPKGVMLSFENLLINIRAVTSDVKIITPDATVMMLLPLHHIFPLMGTLIMPLYVGAAIAVSPSMKPDDIMATLNDNQVSIIISVPRFYETIRKGILDKIGKSLVTKWLFRLAGSLRSMKFSRFVFAAVHKKFGGNIRYMVSGGAPLGKEIANDFYTLGFELLEGYGMTEAAPMIAFTRPGGYIPGSTGQAIPGMKMKINDGEIVASGRNIMQGYYNRPEETKEIVKNGWLYTGDLGYIDKNGAIYITGRKKEIIVLPSGKNINPAEIEQKLGKMSAYVKEAGVFLHHNVLQVLIVPDLAKMKADGIENHEEYIRWEVIDRYNRTASSYKKLMKFSVSVQELPKTRLSKLQRFKLAEIAVQRGQRRNPDIEEPDFKEYRAIKKFLQEETEEEVYATDHIEMDIALDSLGKVTLQVFIENTFGVSISEQQFSEFPSLLVLCEYVRDKKTKVKFDLVNWSDILKEKIHFHVPGPGFSLRFLNFISRLLLNTFFRIKAEGKKNISTGPFILAPNHQSFLDGFIVASFLRSHIMKNTYVYAKEKHWPRNWMKSLAGKNNIILMDINNDLKTSIQKLAEVLRKGKNIIIFPEGTRSRDGKLGTFKKTFAILSRELNIPVIPVAINGSFRLTPPGRMFPRLFGRVDVAFLQPVYPVKQSYDDLRDAVYSQVARKISRTM
ncbi:MAG: AMP-binding protein [Bacteroidales bacterium]|jgi:long-chain acyl-CoA synthetase